MSPLLSPAKSRVILSRARTYTVACLWCSYQGTRATRLSLYDLLRLYEHLMGLKGLKVFPLSLIVFLLRPTGFSLMSDHLVITHGQDSPCV